MSLTDYQKVRCGLELEPIERLKAEKRKIATLPKKGEKGFQSHNVVEIFPPHNEEEKGTIRDIVAKEVGFGSGRQYEKAKKVYQEAPEPIKKQWHINTCSFLLSHCGKSHVVVIWRLSGLRKNIKFGIFCYHMPQNFAAQ